MTSARITGSNEQITTYGTAGRTYTSLSTWESDTDTDHVTDAETDVLECFDDQASFDDTVVMAGSTNNSSFFRIIRPASGQEHDGTPDIGVYFKSTASASCIDVQETNSSIQDLLLTLNINSGIVRNHVVLGGDDASAIACIVFDGLNSAAGFTRGFQLNNPDTIAVLCIAHNTDGEGFELNPATVSDTVYLYNCVANDNDDEGFDYTSTVFGTVVCKNCIGENNPGDDFDPGIYTGSTNNASSDATAPGTSSRINQTFTFVDKPNDDFHLAPNDAGAKNFGADLSADAVFAFDQDIDEDTFTTWDIGVDEPSLETIMIIN